ncbi:hemerythrin HHE cation binding domain-containing protein [Streptomyces sp. Amel2xB2]|uniref:hemerythrin domain-containing protein n=1 Tax=Streptomyces sp. Amel2xB2 TaxID=1305829 RepID=UPI000DB9896B|nr:hemerythrin domain-containing protein [Streptomyces sp. Amel2xB2]RAJ61621.1 hemerythrin HHE cation binding domain-containing protein [Streptomyces sp. Amel2xB2]
MSDAHSERERRHGAAEDHATEDRSTDDVVELILRDHRTMEDLFREMRNVEADRAAALRRLADLLIAHAEAEEAEVYPALRRYRKVDEEDVEHSVEEHAEGNEALLALLEAGPPGGEGWDEKLEGLVQAVAHHLDEEERSLVNDARLYVGAERRRELGRAFARARRDRLASAPGRPENVRRVLADTGRSSGS